MEYRFIITLMKTPFAKCWFSFLVCPTALILLFAETAFACSCGEAKLNTALDENDVSEVRVLLKKYITSGDPIFYGRVSEQRESFSANNSPQFGAKGTATEFLVRNAWSGVTTEKAVLVQSASSCSLKFELGRYYLIFAERNEDKSLTVSVCSTFFEQRAIPRLLVEELERIQESTIFGPAGVSHRNDIVWDNTDGRSIPIK